MREFFVDEVIGVPFRIFGPVHIFITLITILMFGMIIMKRNKIYSLKRKTKDRIRIAIALIMFVNMAIYYNMFSYYGIYDVKVHLPLHLCFIGGFTFMFALLTGNAKVYRFAYFLSFVGPIPAMLWPDIASVDSFIFIQFIISHHFFILSSLFIYYAYDITITKKDMWKTFFITNIIFLIMIGANIVFGTNYIMSKSFPETFLNLYPFLRHFDYPIILLELAGIIGMYAAYLPVYFHKREQQSLELNQIQEKA